MNTGKLLADFYLTLEPPVVPKKMEWLYPQQDKQVQMITKQFFKKYFSDNQQRHLLIGINPGRHGAGITGINFTAPRQLTEDCGILHPFKISSELSAEFIYEVINAYGGPASFYAHWFIGAVCPLGFVKNGKNINYYDDPSLLKAVTPFIVKGINKVLAANISREYCVCIGEDKNYRFLNMLNEKFQWFNEIRTLPHPRFIMQYKRKYKQQYIEQYLSALKKDAT